mgnify:CR=1 FL=1
MPTYKYGAKTRAKAISMENALETWLSNPLLSFRDVAEKAGISEDTFKLYRDEPTFMDEFHKRNRERFKCMEAKALEVLENKLDDEDWKACEYVLNGLDFGGKTKIEATTATTITINVGDEDAKTAE